ncbi:MAG: UvrD-helicase domain-containing protein [Chitinophagales bacterium]|nr:UvrD-helicase domain-containing protein [Chitinophagales bacterium]
MNFLQELNAPQLDAVCYTKGPMLIIAGPGSGKTRVLTYRIAYLIENGIDPFQILALTFTNKASAEMRARIEKIVGAEARNLFMGTFHSVFARILRKEAGKLGYPSNFTIYDTNDSKSVLKAIIKAQGLDEKIYKPSQVFYRISQAKNALISPQAYAENIEMLEEDAAAGKPKIAKLYALYALKCKQNGAMDFDDLLVNFHLLLVKFPESLYYYQNKFQHILIDEFQDTNTAQYAIIKKLADANQQLSVVGDDAQSIYAFRGATITNILNFQRDFPDYHLVKLEQNYRSTPQIVKAANHLIKHNKAQIAKEIWTSNQLGEAIKVFKTASDNEEGKKVADLIFELKMRENLSNNDFAILYRTNAQSRAMEEALRRMNIPYRIYGGLSFYQRKEIKDLLAYLKLTVNPKEEESLRRVINYPKRGIGDTTIDKLTVLASENNCSIWEILEKIEEHSFPTRTTQVLREFVTMIQSFQTMLTSKNAYDLAAYAAKSTHLLQELYNDKTVEGVSRYENIQELLNGIKEFSTEDVVYDFEELGNDRSLGAYLQNISLLTGDEKQNDNEESVKMMTIHAAKGLEFPVVFSVGLEENLFPSAMSLYTREDLEEERRLFYVAITRAEKHLYISYANTRYKFGNLQFSEPSRFLKELPETELQFLGAPVKKENNLFERKSESGLSSSAIQQQRKALLIRRPNASNTNYDEAFEADDPSNLKVGQSVLHQRFGKGVVTHIAEGVNSIASIQFEQEGEKKIMLKFAKLKILD